MCMVTRACAWAEGVRRTRFAALMGVLAVAVLAAVVMGAHHQRTVLDDKVDDPLADLDETPHEWTDEHGAGYDPEQQNVWAEDGAFEPPFVGYAKKDLKWRAPAEPETNALDYLPTVPAFNTRSLPATLCTLHLFGPTLEPCSIKLDSFTNCRDNSRSRNRWSCGACWDRTLPLQTCGPMV
jgi:hypothetical protein